MNALTTFQSNEVAAPKMRFKCCSCTTEVSMGEGSYEDAMRLLEYGGWRLGSSLICPACLKAKARRFKRDYLDEE